MPKELQKDPSKFETFLDRQSGEDSNFRIRSRLLWHDFVRGEEDRLYDTGNSIRFTIAEATGTTLNHLTDQVLTFLIILGLQDSIVDFRAGSDRSSERYNPEC